MIEDFSLEHVAPDHRQRRGRGLGCGLLDHVLDARRALGERHGLDDAVLARIGQGHVLHRQHAAPAALGARLGQLPHGRHRGIDQVVGEDHGERLVAHHGLRAQHGMAQAQGLGLADIDEVHAGGRDLAHDAQQLVLALRGELGLEFRRPVEVILDGALVAAGDEDHVGDACGHGLLDRVLDQGLVHHRQHLLGHGLGGRQEAGAETGDGEHGSADGFHGELEGIAAMRSRAMLAAAARASASMSP